MSSALSFALAFGDETQKELARQALGLRAARSAARDRAAKRRDARAMPAIESAAFLAVAQHSAALLARGKPAEIHAGDGYLLSNAMAARLSKRGLLRELGRLPRARTRRWELTDRGSAAAAFALFGHAALEAKARAGR